MRRDHVSNKDYYQNNAITTMSRLAFVQSSL